MPNSAASFTTLPPAWYVATSTALSVKSKAPLRLLRRAFRPHRVRRLGQIEQRSKAFYVVREVRVSLHKVHVCAFMRPACRVTL
jgi:hypothetical protein